MERLSVQHFGRLGEAPSHRGAHVHGYDGTFKRFDCSTAPPTTPVPLSFVHRDCVCLSVRTPAVWVGTERAKWGQQSLKLSPLCVSHTYALDMVLHTFCRTATNMAGRIALRPAMRCLRRGQRHLAEYPGSAFGRGGMRRGPEADGSSGSVLLLGM